MAETSVTLDGNTYELDQACEAYMGRARVLTVSANLGTCRGSYCFTREAQLVDGLYLAHKAPWVNVTRIYLSLNETVEGPEHRFVCDLPLPREAKLEVVEAKLEVVEGKLAMPRALNLLAGVIPLGALWYTELTLNVEIEPNPRYAGTTELVFVEEHRFTKRRLLEDLTVPVTERTRIAVTDGVGMFEHSAA